MIRFSFFLCLVISTCSLSAQSAAFGVEVSGEGDPIVFIPGLASDGAVWEATVAQLADHYECHVLTLAGFAGQPPLDTLTPWLPQMEESLIAYLEALGTPATMIGHSLGGFLSLSVAVHRPALPARVLIVDSYPFYSAAMYPGTTEATAEPQAVMLRERLRGLSSEQYAASQRRTMAVMAQDSADTERIVDWSVTSHRGSVGQAMYELMTTDLREEVRELSCPVTVLGAWYSGKEYGMTAASVAATYRQQFSRSPVAVKVEMAPTAFHFIMLDQPEWFMDQVLDFLGKH